MSKTISRHFVALAALILSAASMPALASYLDSHDFSTLSTAWDPGANTARGAAGNPAPGGATWSIMAAGISDGINGDDPHGGASTTDITGLLPGYTLPMITTLLSDALDVWAAPSLFTNLGLVADGGVDFGDTDANGGHLGDIRVGAIFIDGAAGTNVLAHAFNPCINGLCSAGGSLGGDLHFDNSNTWVDDPNADAFNFDFFTVALHEFGHSLGMGHSNVVGSVMEATYAGARRTLHADDIAGIQAIYGAAATVPLPAPAILFLSALGLLRVFGRRVPPAQNPA